jgi:hypothetical protein
MKAYKKRMVEEFNQLRDRTNKLEKMLRKNRLDKIEFEPTCPIYLLKKQYDSMLVYMECLKDRAILEDIDLEY